MPIYEYRCKSCGKEFEIMQNINSEPFTICEFCRGPLQKLISQCTFHLKGTGWYATDYVKKPESQKIEEGKKGSSSEDLSKSASKDSSKESSKES